MRWRRRGRKLSRFDFREQGCEGGGGELGSVHGGGWKVAESAGDIFCGDGAGVGDSFAGEFFGEERGAGDCRGAALAEETCFGDAAVFDASREMQDVAADRVGDFDGSCGVGEFTGVAWVLEVIEDGGAEHGFQYRKNPVRTARTGRTE